MAAVGRYYRNAGWDVENVSRTQPFDFLCTRDGGTELCVEVKGTTSEGNTVLLTPGEVRHVPQRHPRTALAIIYGIQLAERADGSFEANGARQWLIEPWSVDKGTPTPLAFEYTPPRGLFFASGISSSNASSSRLSEERAGDLVPACQIYSAHRLVGLRHRQPANSIGCVRDF
jgi:hypothetical protein